MHIVFYLFKFIESHRLLCARFLLYKSYAVWESVGMSLLRGHGIALFYLFFCETEFLFKKGDLVPFGI